MFWIGFDWIYAVQFYERLNNFVGENVKYICTKFKL